MTRIQALRMAAANKLRKRIDYDLSCRLSPEGDLTAWRRATPDERRVYGRRVRLGLKDWFGDREPEQQEREALTEPFQPTGDHWLDAHYRVTREGRVPEQEVRDFLALTNADRVAVHLQQVKLSFEEQASSRRDGTNDQAY